MYIVDTHPKREIAKQTYLFIWILLWIIQDILNLTELMPDEQNY